MKLSWCSQGGSSELGCRQVGRRVQGCSCHGLFCLCCLFSCKSGGCAKWTEFRNQAGFSMFTLFSCIWEIIAGVWTSTYFLNMLWSTYAKLLFCFHFDYRSCPNLCWILELFFGWRGGCLREFWVDFFVVLFYFGFVTLLIYFNNLEVLC